MEDEEKICPILSFGHPPDWVECLRERCAWWVAYAWNVGCCAIKHLAEQK